MRAFKMAGIFLGALGGISGLGAAFYWRRASLVPIVPAWGDFEPLETDDKAIGWALGSLEAFTASSGLNAKAANWTALSVVLSTASCFVGSLA